MHTDMGSKLIVIISLSFPNLMIAQTQYYSEIIVQLAVHADVKNVLWSSRSINRSNIGEPECLNTDLNIYIFTLEDTSNYVSIVSELRANPKILRLEPNVKFEPRARTPNDPRFNDQWSLHRVGIPEIWYETTGGLSATGDTIVVGVMEQGLDIDHEDMNSILWINREEIPNNNIDDDGNGYVDDYYGVSLDHGKDLHQEAEDGHGTSVLGVIGANGDNLIGISGANWNIKIMLFTTSDLSIANAIKAYSYFVDMRRKYNETNGERGAFVVASNSSFGRDGFFEKDFPIFCGMFNEMGEQGILSVGSAENDQGNADVFGDIPSTCTSDELIIVTNTDQNDEHAIGGFGKTSVDLGAPGEQIVTTDSGNGYMVSSGTSYSAPLVCGAAALFFSHPSQELASLIRSDPQASVTLIKDVILDNVVKIPTLMNRTVTEGRLDVASAYRALIELYPINPVGSKSIAENKVPRIFPNPVRDKTQIISDHSLSGFSINFYSPQGRLLFNSKVLTMVNKFDLDISNLPAGMYFLVLKKERLVHVVKLLKH